MNDIYLYLAAAEENTQNGRAAGPRDSGYREDREGVEIGGDRTGGR